MKINPDLCISCGMCLEECPVNAIDYSTGKGYKRAVIDDTLCVNCGSCKERCPNDAIEY